MQSQIYKGYETLEETIEQLQTYRYGKYIKSPTSFVLFRRKKCKSEDESKDCIMKSNGFKKSTVLIYPDGFEKFNQCLLQWIPD